MMTDRILTATKRANIRRIVRHVAIAADTPQPIIAALADGVGWPGIGWSVLDVPDMHHECIITMAEVAHLIVTRRDKDVMIWVSTLSRLAAQVRHYHGVQP
jgi:hypothetical protein